MHARGRTGICGKDPPVEGSLLSFPLRPAVLRYFSPTRCWILWKYTTFATVLIAVIIKADRRSKNRAGSRYCSSRTRRQRNSFSGVDARATCEQHYTWTLRSVFSYWLERRKREDEKGTVSSGVLYWILIKCVIAASECICFFPPSFTDSTIILTHNNPSSHIITCALMREPLTSRKCILRWI